MVRTIKPILLGVLIAYAATSEEKPSPEPPKAPTFEQLHAENEAIRAELEQLRLEMKYALMVCGSPDVMAARLKSIQAQQRSEAAKKEPPKDAKKD